MRENINSYAPDFYKEEPNVDLKGHLDGLDKIITEEGPYKGRYPGASEIVQKGCCDLVSHLFVFFKLSLFQLIDGVFYAETDKEGSILTQNLVSDHQFNPNELAYDVV